ncbi:MAG: type II toxin-antitoxin system RelE/ParE family toxin [Dysgonamonadaceae bacterium]|jgi:plasmid stabilization system protein ParE|nr:type II toxin-antitoxin system RelE/ParE family toxin [Dysgonamonadaceae bacterium]
MAKQIKLPKRAKQRKIIISTEFINNLARVKNYGEELFGKTVSNKFVKEIRQKIAFLSKQPDANPKNRFIASTNQKTYRNIIHKSYCVLYSVTATTIDVIDIYHSAQSPEYVQTLEK